MTSLEKQLCKKCKLYSIERQKSIQKTVRLHSSVFSIKNTDFVIGSHAFEKAKKFSININKQRKNIQDGKMIEVQRGRDLGEYKYIYRWEDEKNKPYHAIFLFTPNETRLINVYDPSYDMDFKWNENYDRRIYFNEMRKCCVLQEDKVKNIDKSFQQYNQPEFYKQFSRDKEIILQRFKEKEMKKKSTHITRNKKEQLEDKLLMMNKYKNKKSNKQTNRNINL